MKFLFKLALKLLLVLVVLAGVAFLSWDWIVKKVAEHRIAAVTGMEARFDQFVVGVAKPVIHIENFRLYNPAEFGGAPLVDMPELHVEYDPAALRSGLVRIRLLRVNLAEVNLVRNAAGQTNINFLRERLASQKMPGRGAGKNDSPKSGVGGLRFERIETLNLTLGKLRFSDLGQPQNNREANLGVRGQVFQNIRSEEDVYGMAFVLLLKCGPELLEQFSAQMRNAASGSVEQLKDAADKARGLIKK